MKKVTEKSLKAFISFGDFKQGNMDVYSGYGCSGMRLHGNAIAGLCKQEFTNTLKLIVRDCGRRTNTTKERLNAILQHFNLGTIFQKDFTWYFRNPDGTVESWRGTKVFENLPIN